MRGAKQVAFPEDRPLTEKEFKKFYRHAQNSASWSALNTENSEAGLRDKLYRKGYPEGEIEYVRDESGEHVKCNIVEDVMAELVDMHLLDEESTAQTIAERRFSSGWGSAKVRMDLQHKKFPPELVASVLQDFDQHMENDNSALVELLLDELKLRSRSEPEMFDARGTLNYGVKSKITQKMVRRGFSFGDIGAALDEAVEQFLGE